MSDSEQEIRDLEAAIEEAVLILRRHEVAYWPSRLESALALIRRRKLAGLEDLLRMYGGMGSINDVSILQFNGHRIEPDEEIKVNKDLRDCLSRAWNNASSLHREER